MTIWEHSCLVLPMTWVAVLHAVHETPVIPDVMPRDEHTALYFTNSDAQPSLPESISA